VVQLNFEPYISRIQVQIITTLLVSLARNFQLLSLTHSANLGAVYILLTVSLNWVLRIILEHKREDRKDCIMRSFMIFIQ